MRDGFTLKRTSLESRHQLWASFISTIFQRYSPPLCVANTNAGSCTCLLQLLDTGHSRARRIVFPRESRVYRTGPSTGFVEYLNTKWPLPPPVTAVPTTLFVPQLCCVQGGRYAKSYPTLISSNCRHRSLPGISLLTTVRWRSHSLHLTKGSHHSYIRPHEEVAE